MHRTLFDLVSYTQGTQSRRWLSWHLWGGRNSITLMNCNIFCPLWSETALQKIQKCAISNEIAEKTLQHPEGLRQADLNGIKPSLEKAFTAHSSPVLFKFGEQLNVPSHEALVRIYWLQNTKLSSVQNSFIMLKSQERHSSCQGCYLHVDHMSPSELDDFDSFIVICLS